MDWGCTDLELQHTPGPHRRSRARSQDPSVIQNASYKNIVNYENMAIKIATGEFIAQACVDDRHSPHYLETLAKHLHYSTEIDLVYTDCYQTTQPNETFFVSGYNGNV